MFGFGTKKKQVIKFEQNLCNASVNDNSVLFVRVNDVVTAKDAIIEVPYTHNAFVIKGGGDCRFYKSGNYPVFDNKAEVKNWKTGLSVEVVYIPKETEVLIRWGTPTKVKYRDLPIPFVSRVIQIDPPPIPILIKSAPHSAKNLNPSASTTFPAPTFTLSP